MLQEARDECRQLTREQLYMVVMGQLHALCHRDPLTQKNKVQNSERYIHSISPKKEQRFQYYLPFTNHTQYIYTGPGPGSIII